MSEKPLAGIRVVELSTFVAAPSCARSLASFGADVIKVEGFNGDPWRTSGMNMIRRGADENPIFDVYNADKRSICINIKTDAGLEALHRLLEKADIFITNTRAKSLVKLGLDAETLLKRYPRLIFASVDGFGDVGPDAASPGFDNVAFWTRSGFLLDMAIESAGSYPVMPPTGGGDVVSGDMLLSGILAALYRREKTGRGDTVKVSLYGAAIWMNSSMIIRAEPKYGEHFPKTRGQMNPFTTQYRCADGEWFCITILEYDRYAAKVYELLGVTDEIAAIGVDSYASMKANSAKMMPIMEKAFASKPLAEWVEIFHKADIVGGAMTHLRDVAEDEQARLNHFVEDYTFRNGETAVMPCPPCRFGSCGHDASKIAPLPGEQTNAILSELGYSEKEIELMRNDGAVK